MQNALAIFSCNESCAMACEIGRSSGYQITSANSFSDASEKTRSPQNLVVLQLEIALESGGTPRQQHGINLLRQIAKKMPVVVVMDRKARFEVAVECMRLGAIDVIAMPCDLALGMAIARAQEAQPEAARVSEFRAAPREIIIYPSSVSVCGVNCWTDRGDEDLRKALIMLSAKSGGEFARIGGADLCERLGRDDSNSIRRSIKDFRDKATRLLASRGIVAGRNDIIDTQGGYHFSENVSVRVEDADKRANSDVLKALAGLSASKAERCSQICEAIAGAGMSRAELRGSIKISKAQFERDINTLSGLGVLKKSGARGEMKYRLSEALNAVA